MFKKFFLCYKVTRDISNLFRYGGEKAERTISGMASPFHKCERRCFVSGGSHHRPSNCLAFWCPQTISRRRSPIVWYRKTNKSPLYPSLYQDRALRCLILVQIHLHCLLEVCCITSNTKGELSVSVCVWDAEGCDKASLFDKLGMRPGC